MTKNLPQKFEKLTNYFKGICFQLRIFTVVMVAFEENENLFIIKNCHITFYLAIYSRALLK